MTNQHFFMPLLPGFHSHLKIPMAFFLKNIEGRNEQKMAELRSDASELTWEVKLDGQRLTDGWKEFALSHDLRIGDIVVFRQERDMSFHVTLFGPSCCEIQSVSCSDDQNNLGKTQRKERVRKNPIRETESSPQDLSCFEAKVSPATLRYDRLNLPRSFVSENGLETRCGEIVLMNEKGKSWTVDLRGRKSCETSYIKRGWRSFCHANGLRAGSFFTFKLIRKGRTLTLRLSPKEPEEQVNEVSLSAEPENDEESNLENIQRKKNPRRELESSSLDPSCFVAKIAPSTLRYDLLYLPRRFVRENGLETRCGEMILMNEKGRSWTFDMKRKNSCGTIYIRRGWRGFCRANGLKAGSFCTFKLIQNGGTLVLRLSPKEPEEEEEEFLEANVVESLSTEASDEESSQDEKSSQECSKRKERKRTSIWKASSSASQNRFVTVALTRYNVSLSRLILPIPFTKANGLEKAKEISFLDKHGLKRSTKIRFEKKGNRMRLLGGWKEFCDANGVKIGESIMLKLIWEADRNAVLKFCSKVRPKTK